MGWGDSWGSSARQNGKDVAAAFYEGRSLKRSGCETDGTTYCYSNCILARRIKDEDIPCAVEHALNGGEWVCRKLEFRFQWADKATARHLQALGVDATYHGKHDGPRINGKPVELGRWYTPAEIAALKPAPPAPARSVREPRFVNLTLPLFT